MAKLTKISISSLCIDIYQLLYVLIGILSLYTTGGAIGLSISKDEKIQTSIVGLFPFLIIGIILISALIESIMSTYTF